MRVVKERIKYTDFVDSLVDAIILSSIKSSMLFFGKVHLLFMRFSVYVFNI